MKQRGGNRAGDTERFFGLNSFVFNTSEADFTDRFRYYYDFNNPMPNPITHIDYKERLITSINDFVKG